MLAINATFRLRDTETGEPFPAQDPELYGNQDAASKLPLGGVSQCSAPPHTEGQKAAQRELVDSLQTALDA